MDTLTFGSPILLRHLTFSEAKKMPISEISLRKSLDGLGFSMDEVRLSIYILLLLSRNALDICSYFTNRLVQLPFLY